MINDTLLNFSFSPPKHLIQQEGKSGLLSNLTAMAKYYAVFGADAPVVAWEGDKLTCKGVSTRFFTRANEMMAGARDQMYISLPFDMEVFEILVQAGFSEKDAYAASLAAKHEEKYFLQVKYIISDGKDLYPIMDSKLVPVYSARPAISKGAFIFKDAATGKERAIRHNTIRSIEAAYCNSEHAHVINQLARWDRKRLVKVDS